MNKREEKFIRSLMKYEGSVVFKDFFKEELINQLRIQVKAVFRTQIRRYKARDIFHLFEIQPQVVKNCGKIVQNLPLLFNIASCPEVLDVVGTVLGRPVITTKPIVHFHHPRLAENEVDWKTPPHQDIGSVQSSLNSVVLWFPLVSCRNDDIGPLEAIPESHKNGSQWDHFEGSFAVCSHVDDNDFSKIRLDVGDLLMFNQALIHRSGSNKTEDQPRWSVTLRYGDLEASDWISRDYRSPYKYKPDMDSTFTFNDDDMELALSTEPLPRITGF